MGNWHTKQPPSKEEPMPALHQAILSGNIAFLEKLILRLGDNEQPDSHGITALCVAAQKGENKMISLLLELGADPAIEDKSKMNVLHHAGQNGHIHTIKYLLRTPAAFMIDYQDVWGYTPLMRAVIAQKNEIAHTLISERCSVTKADSIKRMPIHIAASYGNVELITTLVDHGSSVNVYDNKGRTPLYFAMLANQVDTVRHLVNLGACVNVYVHEEKISILQTSVERRHIACAKILLDAGANVIDPMIQFTIKRAQKDLQGAGEEANDLRSLYLTKWLLSAMDGTQLTFQSFMAAWKALQATNNDFFLHVLYLLLKAGIPRNKYKVQSCAAHPIAKQFVAQHLKNAFSLQDSCRLKIREILTQCSGNVWYGLGKIELPHLIKDVLLLSNEAAEFASTIRGAR